MKSLATPLALTIIAFAPFLGPIAAQAQITISNFSTVNPLDSGFDSWFSFPGGNQFQSFTDGAVMGQEVVPIGGGNPTGSGFAILGGFAPLDLTAQTSLQLTARLLAGNAVSEIGVKLQDTDGTDRNYVLSGFNSVTFTTASVLLSSGFQIDPGGDGGVMDFDRITNFRMQGTGGTANFQVQFDTLGAVPEPALYGLMTGLGLMIFATLRYFRSPRAEV